MRAGFWPRLGGAAVEAGTQAARSSTHVFSGIVGGASVAEGSVNCTAARSARVRVADGRISESQHSEAVRVATRCTAVQSAQSIPHAALNCVERKRDQGVLCAGVRARRVCARRCVTATNEGTIERTDDASACVRAQSERRCLCALSHSGRLPRSSAGAGGPSRCSRGPPLPPPPPSPPTPTVHPPTHINGGAIATLSRVSCTL